MVEFALVLPLLALLLVLTIDVGRVFFGWVALQNATRIGANDAARNPQPWSLGDTDDGYYNRIARDLEALNCDADTDNDGDIDADDLPDPTFTNVLGDPTDPYENGDHATVELNCGFGFITPIAGAILGNPLTISATSTFTVIGNEINGIPVGAEPPTAACPLAGTAEVPDLTDGNSVASARVEWSQGGFSGPFVPEPGPDDGELVIAQSTTPSSVAGDCIDVDATMTVTSEDPEPCDPGELRVPYMEDATVAEARAIWAAIFGTEFLPASGFDDEVVTNVLVSTGALEGDCTAEDATVLVDHQEAEDPLPPTCTAQDLTGLTPAAALTQHQNVGQFTGTFTSSPSNKPSWVVDSQDLVGGQTYPCTASITVNLRNPNAGGGQ